MKPQLHFKLFIRVASTAFTLISSVVWALEPDLTAPGIIEALKLPDGGSKYGARSYDDTYNLGATGMRGWIYDYNPFEQAKVLGLSTEFSRKILVTTVGTNTPAAGILQKDDVILGVSWGNNFIYPFASDARKSFGFALGEAEKTENGGYLNIRFWRAGLPVTDVKLKLGVMGTYTATAPYNCPKSTKILENARAQLLRELAAKPDFLSTNYGFAGAGAVNGLALLSVISRNDPDYFTVQPLLKASVDALIEPTLEIAQYSDKPIWWLAYENIFLSEYYMRTVENGVADASALAKLNKFTVVLAKAQSLYGTYGHEGATLKENGSLHGRIGAYGSINCAGLAANISIVLGRKALLIGGVALDPEIDLAIYRANKFFGYYANKGTIPYGEHSPYSDAHALNGKDQMCAVFFSLQDNKQLESEYFSRISVAGYNGREEGHNGSGFNYLWEGMGANVGGPLASAGYLNQIKWSLDLERRTDGSFTYDGQRTAAFAGSTTSDGSYLGRSDYYGLNPTACHILTYSVPLKSLYITGKNTYANVLGSIKVENAVSAGRFQLDIKNASNELLVEKLGEYDPVIRDAAAKELYARSTSKPLNSSQISGLVASITDQTLSNDVNRRIGACTVLGNLTIASALPALTQRLSDNDLWVRAKAAMALGKFGDAAGSQLDAMLRIYTQNAAPDPDIIDWSDPIQFTNGSLSNAIFEGTPNLTISSPKSTFYPALKLALKQPDSIPRKIAAEFAQNRLTYDDTIAMKADLVVCVNSPAQADAMFARFSRAAALSLLEKYKIPEGIQAATSLLTVPRVFDWGAETTVNAGLDALASYGFSATSQLPALRLKATTWLGSNTPQLIAGHPKLLRTIAKIESSVSNPNNDITSFAFPGLAQATISGTNITVKVPAGTNVTSLSPTYTHSFGATPAVPSGTNRNFSTAQVYPIIAADLNLSVKLYTVSVILPEPPVTPPISAITYDFNNGTLQGWNNRVWNGTTWVDLDSNVTAYSGTWLPSSSLNGLFVPSNGAVWVSGNTDNHLNTLWLRSPQFYLNGSGDLIVQLAKGIAYGSAPANAAAVLPEAVESGGWKGIALRRVRDDVFVLAKSRLGASGDDFRPVTFTMAELASLNQNEAYTLELINSGRGGWGWLTMDNVLIPGSKTLPNNNTASVGTTSWGPNRVDTFVIGADKNLYWKFWDGSNWSQYSSLNTVANVGIGVTNWGVNRLDIFYATSNGSMRHKWYTGSWSAEEDQGGVIIGSPAATSWAANRIDVLCRGTDNRLYWKYYNGSWSGWTPVGLGVDVYSSPTVTNWGANRLDVFYASSSGSLRHKWYTGSWTNEEDLGGKMVGGPSAIASNNNRIDVILRGTDNQLYWKFWNGSSWSGFTPLGVYAYSDPTVSSRGSNQLDVFYKGASGVMKQKNYYLGSWSQEYDLGSPAISSMVARANFAFAAPSLLSTANVAPVFSDEKNTRNMPVPWIIGSIGGGPVSTSTKYNAGTASQTGSGSLGSTNDKLTFNYQTLSGDGEITAKISLMHDTGARSGVGVMIRETLAMNSKYVFMGMSGADTYRFSNRKKTGYMATFANTGSGNFPNTWVKLVRVGNVITASKSTDGAIWVSTGSTNISMATSCYIGLAVSSGSETNLNSSQFSNLTVKP